MYPTVLKGSIALRRQHLHPASGQRTIGTKTEIKNLNSFKALYRALSYEVERQTGVLNKGGRIVQETRTWDEREGVTLPLRSKEYAHDYRYFPDPDLVPMIIDPEWVEDIRRSLPELPDALRKVPWEYGLPGETQVFNRSTRELADF